MINLIDFNHKRFSHIMSDQFKVRVTPMIFGKSCSHKSAKSYIQWDTVDFAPEKKLSKTVTSLSAS